MSRKTPTNAPKKRTLVPRIKRSRAKIALVLGGGGLKGFAHIGVIKALQELAIDPTVVAGTSIGALIAAAYGGGMSVQEMSDRARRLQRRDLFRINRMGMLLERTRSPSIYLEAPLRAVVESVVPNKTFHEMGKRILVNTVDIQRGTQLVWGLHGLRDANVADAVYASCALPGFFPPGVIDRRHCVDGGVIDNLPVAAASLGMDIVLAVDTGSSDVVPENDIAVHGFTSIYMRAATTMMHALQLAPFAAWNTPPMILIRPKVSHIGWFSFSHTDEVIEAGYTAAMEALANFEECMQGTGVYPRRSMEIVVDPNKCIGCELCVALAPRLMAMDGRRKAYPVAPIVEWSPADGDFVHHCPTYAIEVTRLETPGTRGGATTVDPTSEATTEATHSDSVRFKER